MPANLKIFLFFILSTNITLAQIIPSFQGVYDKKSSSTSTSNYALDFDGSNDHITTNGGTISSAWSVEVWFKKSQNKSAHNFTNKANSNNSGTWSLRLGQWNNRNKIGITKYGTKDYYIDNSTTDTDIDEWEHVAWTYESNRVRIYVNGEYIGNTFRSYQSSSTTNNLSATLY